jgi:hypothetical protein
MTTQTTRRAVLAGAAALPALTIPAIAADNSDAKIIELGAELMRRVPLAEQAWKEYKRHHAKVERIHRRLKRGRAADEWADLWKLAKNTPAGRASAEFYDQHDRTGCWDLACEIQNLKPQTPRGLAYYAIAVAWCDEDRSQHPDLALVVRAATRLGGVDVPSSFVGWLQEARPWLASYALPKQA